MANEMKSSATLVDVRELNLSDAGSIPAISTKPPLRGFFFVQQGAGKRKQEKGNRKLETGKGY